MSKSELRDNTYPEDVHFVNKVGREFIIVGTAHISRQSADLVREVIEKEKPDVIILDIKMVSSNGLDVLQEIRNKFYNLPVILCSAYGSYKVDIKSIAADAYVVKSSDLTELKIKIAQVLETTVPI